MTSSTQPRPNKLPQIRIYQAIAVHIAICIIRISIAAKSQHKIPIISVDIPHLRN